MKDNKKNVTVNDSLMGLVITILGICYLIMTIALPKAAMGGANEPKMFPLMIAIILIILGVTFMFKSGFSNIKVAAGNFVSSYKKDKETNLTIIITCLGSIGYALLFKRIGYVISTFLFLELLLYLTRKEKLLSNTIIALLFSVGIYVVFSKMLGVTLPKMIFLDI
ncbi:tripartite tricarboxylate transporter TctB family protein [Clostridium sp. DL1XJH146]